MGILDKGEGSAAPLGADYEHREEYRPPLWYRRDEERNPFLRQKKSSGKEKGHTMGIGKGNAKVTNVSGPGAGTTGNSQQVLAAVRAGHGAGREIATVTGLSIQMVGALLSRLSQAKVISKGPDGRWVDLLAPVTKVAKPTRKAAPKGTGLPDESELQKKILSHLGTAGLCAADLAKLLGSKVPTIVLVLRRMIDANLVRKDGQVWKAAEAKALVNDAVTPKPRRTSPVSAHAAPLPRQSDLADVIPEVSRSQSQPVEHKPTVKDFAKDFARVMANSRQLNERVGEMLEIIQDIRAVNDALAAEWNDLQEQLAALERAS